MTSSLKWVLVTLMVSSLLLGGCQALTRTEPTPTYVPPTAAPEQPSLYTVNIGSIAETLRLRGKVVTARQAQLFFEIGGYAKTVNIAAGDQVARGTLLAELEATDLENALADANYELEKAKLTLSQGKSYNEEVNRIKMAQLSIQLYDVEREIAAEAMHSRLLTLYSQKKLLELEMQIQEATAQRAQIDTQILEMAVRHHEALVTRAARKLKKARLYAPFTGLVLSVDAKAGDSVEPYQSIAVLADPTQLQLETSVPEAQIFRVSVGQPASLVLDAYPKATLTGKVKQIASKTTFWQGKSVYWVTIAFDQPKDVPLAIGMGADAVITTRLKANVLVVPTSAITSDGKSTYVDVVEEGEVRRVPVVLGISAQGETEVISGLKAGQVVRLPTGGQVAR